MFFFEGFLGVEVFGERVFFGCVESDEEDACRQVAVFMTKREFLLGKVFWVVLWV